MLTAKDIIDKESKASGIKKSWDSKYREIFDYIMPDRNGFDKPGNTANPYSDTRSQSFDSTGEVAGDEFVATMQEVLCPPYAGWIELEAGNSFPENERDDINRELDRLSGLANEYKNLSNFDVAFSEFCYDLIAGTACMLVHAGSLTSPLVFRAIPLNEYCLEEGRDGEVRGVFRTFSMRKELVRHQWRELKDMAVSEAEGKDKMEIIECVYKDYDEDIYYYYVVDKKKAGVLLTRKSKTNPFVVLRWNKAAGEPYGRGVGMKALNDIKSLNKIMEYSLRAFAFNCPPLLVQEDAMLDPDDFELTPFALNPVPDTQTSIQPLNIQTNHNVESYKIDQMRLGIKQSMMGNTLPPDSQYSARTAYEVSERMNMLRRNLSSVFGRLIGEFVLPLVRRLFEVLIDFRFVEKEFNVSQIDGVIFKIKVNTQLSKQLKASEAQSIINSLMMLTQLDPSLQIVNQVLKYDEVMAYLMDIMGIPGVFIRTPDEIKQIREQQVEAQQQQMAQAIEADVQADNAKAMGKAIARRAEKQP